MQDSWQQYTKTPQRFTRVASFFEKQRFRKRGEQEVQERIQKARFLREAMGLERQFEVLEGSKGFRRKAERSGRQPDVQEDRTRSEGQLSAQKGCQIFRGPAKVQSGRRAA
jgi:hypothetical protein